MMSEPASKVVRVCEPYFSGSINEQIRSSRSNSSESSTSHAPVARVISSPVSRADTARFMYPSTPSALATAAANPKSVSFSIPSALRRTTPPQMPPWMIRTGPSVLCATRSASMRAAAQRRRVRGSSGSTLESNNSATEIGSAGSCSMKNAASFSDNSPTKDKTCGDAAARWRCAATAFSSIPSSDADCSPVKPGGFRKTRRCGYGIRRSTGLLGGVDCCGTVPRGYNPLSSTIRWLSACHVDDRQIHSLRVH